MSRKHHGRLIVSLLIVGVLFGLAGWGGSWGRVYGQTSGPTPTPGSAVLAVSKTVDNPSPRRGQTVTFTIRIQNVGGTAARNVVIRDVMPGMFDVLNATTTKDQAQVRGQTVTVEASEIVPGETVIVTIETRVRNNAQGRAENVVVVRYQAVAGATGSAGGGEVLTTEQEQRATAVLGVSEEAVDDQAPATDEQGGASGPGSQLSPTGMDPATQWPLLLAGLLLIATGGLIFVRVRKTS